MQSVYISLPSPETVQAFARRLSGLKGDFELISDGCILDARSLMGIFSLDLTKPVLLKIYSDTPDNLDALKSFAAPAPPQN
jgi:phosphotransferase system HPr-like phosphotransfer protein